ncbi:putative reverse transcriptase domain-containing protein [Tanacetum coccineum]
MGTSARQVILFGTIPTTIPDTTPTIAYPASPDYSPVSDTEPDPSKDPSSDRIPPLPATLPFLSSTGDSSDTSGALRRRVMILTQGQLVTYGRPYRYHPNGSVHMMTTRKRVGPLPTHRHAVRHSVDYSLSDHFTSDDSLRDSPSSSLSETSSDSYSNALSDSSSGHSSLDHSSPALPLDHLILLTLARKRSRSPATSVSVSSHVLGALSSVRADLLPPRKRIRSSDSVTDLEVSSDESSESSVPRKTEIDECIAYEDALRAGWINVRVVVETFAREEVETSARGTVKLERDNTRLRGTLDVASQRVTQLQCRELRVQREMRQIRRLRFYDRVRIARDAAKNLEPLAEGGDEQGGENGVDYEGGNRGGDGNGNGNGGVNRNGNGGGNGNGNGNGNGGGNGYKNHNVNFGGFMPVARECTYQDFLKCQPLNFKGAEGVVGLTRWFEKMETVFHISNCPQKYQVKYATCTLLESALTWWNTHKRTIRIEAAYAITWTKLMKLMTEVYCLRNEIQKMETELWNLIVKGNDLTAYTRRFQELVLLCTRMVLDEEDKVERFIRGLPDRGLPDNIQGNVIAAEPTKLQDAIRQCGNYKKVGHLTRDCTAAVAPNTHRAALGNQPSVICYECGRPGHYRKDCHKLRNQNWGNKTWSNETTVRDYAIGGGGANPDSNVVTGTFLLNNYYASMLFYSGADKSFVSSTFSFLLDVAPSTLDTNYVVELADGRISETNVVLRGCMLGLLGHPFYIDLMPVELGSFDVIIGMDWLAKYHAVIVYDEKIVRIPYGDV